MPRRIPYLPLPHERTALDFELHPLLILLVGVATVVGMLIGLRIHAFLSLIAAALIVSLLAPGETAEKVSRVAVAFGTTAGSIGIVIALAAVIGRCMIDSGAADRIVRWLLATLGEPRAPAALACSGWILSIPVFFDTVFYLLVPLARSLYRRTQTHYLRYVLAISVGAVATHALVPPTPGPLVVADQLGVDLGVMIAIGALVAVPAALAGLLYAGFVDRRMPVPMRPIGSGPEPAPLEDDALPSLFWSLLPIVLPVLLITSNTVARAALEASPDAAGLARLATVTAIVGNPNLALMLSTAVALLVLQRQRGLGRAQLSETLETSLSSGGVIILITAAGGAFGAMLQAAGVGNALPADAALDSAGGGRLLAVAAFALAAVLKFAQGSSTVAMIGASSIVGALGLGPEQLGFHPVYLATAVGCGSLVGVWMNDSGFWVFARMSGLTEVEALKSWTPGAALVGTAGLVVTLLLSWLIPLA